MSLDSPKQFHNSPWVITRNPRPMIIFKRIKVKGKVVLLWKREGDERASKLLPIDREVLAAEKEYLARANEHWKKVRQHMNRPIGTEALKQKADPIRRAVIELAALHASKGRYLVAFIARIVKRCPRRVRQLLEENKSGNP